MSEDSVGDQGRLSYKFQRLRERLRNAIASGELTGKLPGERILAERFNANAKTLSKALTDLAAEGLLERSIGRGTYVRGSAPAAQRAERWLILAPAEMANDPVIRALVSLNPQSTVTSNVSELRPSFLNQVGGVIDFSDIVPDSFLRDIVVRGIPVVVAGRAPRTFSTHCVMLDVPLSAGYLARELLNGNHHKLATIERKGFGIRDTLRQTASYFSRDASVYETSPDAVCELAHDGITAFVCDTIEDANRTLQNLKNGGYDVPSRVSVTAITCAEGNIACSGYYVSPAQYADSIHSLLQEDVSKRPTTLWLAGAYNDCGTLHARMFAGTGNDAHMRQASPLQ